VVDVYSDTIPEKLAGYEVLKSLGTGVMGQNFLVKNGAFSQVVKTVNHSIVKRMSEAGKLKGDTQHANILAAKEYIVDETFDEVFILDYLSEMVPSTPGFFFAEGIKPTLIAFRAIADGFRFAHDNGVSHNNFKSSNLLVKTRKAGIFPIITDFGYYLKYNDAAFSPALLSEVLGYMAPEVIDAFKKGEEQNLAFYQKGDIYSFGVVLAEALSGRQLFKRTADFESALEEKQECNIQAVGVNAPKACVAVAPIQKLITSALAVHPTDRPDSFSEILDLIDKSLGGTPQNIEE